MKFNETTISGVYLIDLELLEDERGHFARTYCKNEFLHHGLNPHLEQCNLSYNHKKGTLRGMHYQEEPYAEAKLIRCVRGEIFDVVIDLRPQSQTFEHWWSVELSSSQLLYIPEGCAHGFQTLQDGSEVLYQMSSPFIPDAAKGIRWDDPHFKIAWPIEEKIVSKKDQNYPAYL